MFSRLRRNRNHLLNLRQEALLLCSLVEIGINPTKVSIAIDHINGYNIVNGIKFDVCYPKYYFQLTQPFIGLERTHQYHFDGHPGQGNERVELLEKYRNNGYIRYTNLGHQTFTKAHFNADYFSKLASAKYGICPHQPDWPHPDSRIWTYRFIECCMVGTIPMTLHQSPLSQSFTDGFSFFQTTETQEVPPKRNKIDVRENRKLAEQRFTINSDTTFSLYEKLNIKVR